MNIIGTQESSEFWQKRVEELGLEASELERRLEHDKKVLHEVLASGKGERNGEASWRQEIEQLSIAKEDAEGALHQAKKLLRRSLASDEIKKTVERGDRLRKAVADREKKLIAAQKDLITAFRKVSEAIDFNQIIRECGDSQIRSELNNTGGAVAKFIAAKILETMPHAATGAAVALSHPAVTLEQVADKSLIQLVGNPVTDFEKRNPDSMLPF